MRNARRAAVARKRRKKVVQVKEEDPRDHANDSVQFADYPFDVFGRGVGWGSPIKTFEMTLRVLMEQLRGARMVLAMALFYVYLGLFTTVTLSANKGETLYEHNEALRRMIAERELPFSAAQIQKELPDLITFSDFWFYMHAPFVDSIIPKHNDTIHWRGDEGKAQKPRFSRNMKIVGPMRMRQLRVRSDACVVQSATWLKRGADRTTTVVTEAERELYNLFSREVDIRSYVFPCNEGIDRNPQCGHIQKKTGSWANWDELHPAGQVGEVAGCYPEITDATEARSPFGPIYQEGDPLGPNFNLSRWRWHSADELAEGWYRGRSDMWYPGSGYNVTIPRDPEEARAFLLDLQEEQWLDLSTRAVFIDFVVYSPNVDFVTQVKLVFEFRPTGMTLIFPVLRTMNTAQIIWDAKAFDLVYYELVLAGFVVTYVVLEARSCWRTGMAYFLISWNYLSLFNYGLFLAGFIFRLTPYAEFLSGRFPPPEDEFVNFDHAFWAAQQWTNCMAINSIVVWVAAFRYLTFIPFMKSFMVIISHAIGPLVAVVAMFMLILFSFAIAYLLAFGAGVYDFRNLEVTIYSMLRALLGMDSFDLMWDENRLLGPLFYFLWTILGLFIMFSMIIVVLCQTISEHSGGDDVFAEFNKAVRTVGAPFIITLNSITAKVKPALARRRKSSLFRKEALVGEGGDDGVQRATKRLLKREMAATGDKSSRWKIVRTLVGSPRGDVAGGEEGKEGEAVPEDEAASRENIPIVVGTLDDLESNMVKVCTFVDSLAKALADEDPLEDTGGSLGHSADQPVYVDPRRKRKELFEKAAHDPRFEESRSAFLVDFFQGESKKDLAADDG